VDVDDGVALKYVALTLIAVCLIAGEQMDRWKMSIASERSSERKCFSLHAFEMQEDGIFRSEMLVLFTLVLFTRHSLCMRSFLVLLFFQVALPLGF
jgi:hypothetical protein